MLLKDFCDHAGRLWVGSRRRNTPYVSSPSNAFVKKRLYMKSTPRTSHDGGIKWEESTEYEDALARIESAAAPVIRRIIESARRGECPKLPSPMRDRWKLFYLAMARRTPESQQRVTADKKPFPDIFYDVTSNLAAEHGVDFPDQASLYEDWRVVKLMMRVKANVDASFAAGTTPDARMQAERFCKSHGLSIAAITAPKRSFVIGSHGLAIVGRAPGKGCWLPIAHDVAIAVSTQPQRESLLLLNRSRDLMIRKINQASATQSERFAGPSERLVQRLMTMTAG